MLKANKVQYFNYSDDDTVTASTRYVLVVYWCYKFSNKKTLPQLLREGRESKISNISKH